ncbi:hypothetical protein [uncultured Bifidobacterium sp.]|uniref:hypothetical protein n=1 Tax=uncultured Bifidobacterium sp. TaxID=165187 RepID=UPI0028DCEFD8|nr:hypothetical protein [uncultured Bifidobacterium sp.]
MTDLNNSNRGGDGSPSEEPDEEWARFERSHEDDLRDVAGSRAAKRFERHARRQKRKALLSVKDLDDGSFTDDLGAGRGPRDFTGPSILDAPDDDFTPPNPSLGRPRTSLLVFAVLLVAGIAGVIAAAFLPSLAGALGTICGTAAVIGGAGLLIMRRESRSPGRDPDDDGARV